MAGAPKRLKIDLGRLIDKYQAPATDYEDPEDDVDHISPFTHLLVDEALANYTDCVRDAFAEEQDTLQELLPYAEDEGWPWVVGEFKPGHIPLITSVMTLLFGVYMRKCVGSLDEGGEFIPTELFLPIGIQGKSSADRAAESPCYADHGNPRVYKDLRSPISFFVTNFVNLLKTLGYFTASDGDFLAPPHLFNFAATRIQLQLLGDHATAAQPNGGLEERLGHGVRQIKTPRRRQWAILDQVLIVPDPMEKQDWDRYIFVRKRRPGESQATYNAMKAAQIKDRDKYLAQLHMVDPEPADPPCIPSGRHFTDVDAEDFGRLFMIVNGGIKGFVELKDAEKSDAELQQWVSTLTVDLLHEYCPNFMSYIGAQYLQRICVDLQADTFRDTKPGAPRAYFSNMMDRRDDEFYRVYRDAMTSDDDRLVASFVEVFGSMFYSIKTYISAFVGEGGTGKNFLRRVAIKIAGGLKHTFRIDPNHHKFSMSMLKEWTFLLTVEDASDTQMEIPKTFMDSALGGTRGVREEGGNVEAKYGHPGQELVEPLGCCYLRNDPTDEAKGLVGKSRQEKAIACVQGMSGGKDRRVRLAPPLMVRVTEGPVNPTDDENQLAFDHARVDDEIPFLMLISWFTTVAGDLCRDEIYGLVGEGGSLGLDDLNRRYLAMGTINVNDNVGRLIEACPEKVFECPYTQGHRNMTRQIKYSYAVTLQTIKEEYYKMHKSVLKSLPEEYPQLIKRLHVCRDCGLSIVGVKKGEHDTIIPAAHQTCTSPDKDLMIGNCPYDGVPCYKKTVFRRTLLYGYRLRGGPAGDAGGE